MPGVTIGVSVESVLITNIEPGSVIVSFFVAPSSHDNAISSSAAVQRIQNATAGNILRDNLVKEGISCTEPCGVSVVSSVAQQEPRKSGSVAGPSNPSDLNEIAVYSATLVALVGLLPLCAWFACKRLKSTKTTTTSREMEYTDNPVHELSHNRSTQQQLPPNWVERLDPKTQRPYFVNASTGERTWMRPTNGTHASGKTDSRVVVGERWVQRTDAATGRSYFVNISTGQSSWTLPNGAQLDKHVQQHRVQQHRAAGRLARVGVDVASPSVNTDPVLEEIEV